MKWDRKNAYTYHGKRITKFACAFYLHCALLNGVQCRHFPLDFIWFRNLFTAVGIDWNENCFLPFQIELSMTRIVFFPIRVTYTLQYWWTHHNIIRLTELINVNILHESRKYNFTSYVFHGDMLSNVFWTNSFGVNLHFALIE